MKNKFTSVSSLLFFALFFSFTSTVFGQPANDRCDNPTALTLAADAASCVPIDGDTRMAEDATLIQDNYPPVCSGSWYTDDVWYSVDVGATVPALGITILLEMGSQTDDLPEAGMAIYENSCANTSLAIDCFSDEPGRRTILLKPDCITPNSTYLVRVWSAGSPVGNSGTFRICAYESESPFYVSSDIVYWAEDFDGGMGDWTTNSQNAADETWRWYDSGDPILNAFGGSVNLRTIRSICTPKMAYPGGWYQTNQTGDVSQVPASSDNYKDLTSELISPTINLSAVTAPVSLQFEQASRKLNPNAAGNPRMWVAYSLDDGVTWSNPEEINSELVVNDPQRTSVEKVNLNGANGVSTVKIKFVYDMDFYYWIIDNIEIIEREAHNMRANDFFAIAPNRITPRHQAEPINFLIDVENVGAAEQTNVNVNINIVDDGSFLEVYDDNFIYGSVASGFVDENRIFPNAFTPDTTFAASYTATYTVSADSADFNPDNNTQSFNFILSDTIFAKENNENMFSGITTQATNTWTIANAYYVPKGFGYDCTSILFGIGNADVNIGGTVLVNLFEWNESDDNDALITSDERTLIGSTAHVIDGTETDIVVQLENFINSGEPVALKDDTHYLIVLNTTAPAADGVVSIRISNAEDYNAMAFLTDSLDMPRYTAFWNTTSVDLNADLTPVGGAPRIRMHLNPTMTINTDNALSEDNIVEVFPNPTEDQINLNLDLTASFDHVQIRIMDATGKLLRVEDYSNVQNQQFGYNVSSYAPGTYFLQFVSEEGVRTKRFTIAR